MSGPAAPQFDELDDFGGHDCLRCDGTGEVLFCPDDMCHGLGYCIHGDGQTICPDCHGEGWIES